MKKIYKDKPCPKCGNFTNRGVSIDAVIMNKKKVLLVKRGSEPFKGYWATPGGYVGWDETVNETVKREVKEETNLDVTGLTLVGVYSSPSRHPNQVINLLYYVKVKRGKLKYSDDAIDAKWFSVDSLPDKLAFDHKQNISDALVLIK